MSGRCVCFRAQPATASRFSLNICPMRPLTAGAWVTVFSTASGQCGWQAKQVGVSPDQTDAEGVMLGYAFDSQPTPDRVDHRAASYRHPHSFYFSGMPYQPQVPLPNAPIISQNYTDFAMVKPDPAKTWAKVRDLNPAQLPNAKLFQPSNPNRFLGPHGHTHSGSRTWAICNSFGFA